MEGRLDFSINEEAEDKAHEEKESRAEVAPYSKSMCSLLQAPAS